jgi:hypothetical protein
MKCLPFTNSNASSKAILGMTQKWTASLGFAFSYKILGITEAFKADSFKEKINLGVLKQ